MTIDQPAIQENPQFPVRWDDPGDEALQWRFFVQNFPNQVPPLEFDVLVKRIMAGADHAFATLKGSFQKSIAKRINTYVYRAMAPADESIPPESTVEEALAALRDSVDDLARAWQEDYLPQLRAFLDEFGSLDLTALPARDLVDHFDTICARLGRLWEVHFLILFPAAAAVNEFDRTYRELFGGDALDPYVLLSGLPNKTVDIGKELWRLARLAGRHPAVRSVLAEVPADEVIGRLERTEGAAEFLEELTAFLRQYGQRGDMCNLTAPSWLEDPVPVVRNLASYLQRPDDASPALTQRKAAAEREQALTGVRQRLSGYPRPVAELFEKLLAAAQSGSVLTEEHTFYIDYGGVYQVRRVVLEMGRRLAGASVVSQPADVLLLGSDELRAAVVDPHGTAVTTILDANRREMDRFATVMPTPVVGSPVPPPMSPSFMAFMGSMSGMGGPPPGMGAPQADPGTLRGTAGATGVAKGIARIVRTLAEADRLGPAEILVAPTTAPPWTPLFAVAGGVVTDTGGVLSHCAVVAREYGVPTVVGATGATTTIEDGQWIEVNGTAGIVRVLDRL